MKTLAERCQNIWNRITHAPSCVPVMVPIHREHVHGEQLGQAFSPNEHYFQVRINEMYLTDSRQWFSVIDPMVFVVSEFIYDKKVETVPFIVGPAMMKQFEKQIPPRMIFSNTRVAGLHPYRGGRLCLSVILYQVQRKNYAQELLHIIESVATVLDFSTVLSSYLKLANVVLDGIESLLGLEGTVPLIGHRSELDPDAGDHLEPTYFALIDMPDSQPDPNALWVRDHHLLFGASLDTATPFRSADFVLYSITQASERNDVTTLPFYSLYEQVIQEAMKPDDISYRGAKAAMTALAQKMILSPDLTATQADKLADQYAKEMKRVHDKAVDWSYLGPAKATSEVDKKLRQAVTILDL
jgi:hypothetical protein